MCTGVTWTPVPSQNEQMHYRINHQVDLFLCTMYYEFAFKSWVPHAAFSLSLGISRQPYATGREAAGYLNLFCFS